MPEVDLRTCTTAPLRTSSEVRCGRRWKRLVAVACGGDAVQGADWLRPSQVLL